MNSFENCQATGIRGLNEVIAFIRTHAHGGQFVLTDKGNLSEFLQTSVGDILLNDANGKVWGVELKTDNTDHTTTFFLETWSNICFGHQKPGWLVTLKTDILLWYFARTKTLYSIPFRPLFEWAFGSDARIPMLGHYPFKRQGKHQQLNLTCGHSVPVAEVGKYVGFKRYFLTDGSHELRETARPLSQANLFDAAPYAYGAGR